MKTQDGGNTISAQTYQALREAILFGEIAPGTKVTTSELCKRFGASLGAVREALSHLKAEGLVQAEAHRGCTITPVSVDDLNDLTRVRIDIETMCLTSSIQRGKVEWESQLVAAAHFLSKTYRENEPDGTPNPIFESAHNAFHYALVSACGSPRLLQIRAQLFDQSERYRRLDASLRNTHRKPADEHRRITEATLARDIPLANKLLNEHISRTADDVIKAMLGNQNKPKLRRSPTPQKRNGR